MATLEKIRKRSVLLFTIIIVALLAFILGDFLTSGRSFFGHGTTIAEAGDAEVDVRDLETTEKQLTARMEAAGQQGDPDEIRQQAIQKMLFDGMLNAEYDEIGLVVTDKEISQGMLNPMPNSDQYNFIIQMSQLLGLKQPNPQAVLDAVKNPKKYGIDAQSAAQIQATWANNEKDLEEQLRNMKFGSMVMGLYSANELDAKAMYEAVTTSETVSYAGQLFTDIPDGEVKVTDKEIDQFYEKHKARYRLMEDAMALQVIRVPIEPSEADMAAAKKEVEGAVSMLIDDADIPQGVRDNDHFIIERKKAPMRVLRQNPSTAAVAAWLAGTPGDSVNAPAQPGDVKLLPILSGRRAIGKLFAVSEELDSITISQIVAQSKAQADSLLAVLNAGGETAWADYLAKEPERGQEKQEMLLIGNNVPKKFLDRIMGATVGEAFVISDTVQGQPRTGIMRVDERKAPVKVYDYAEISYPLQASPSTVSTLNGALTKFAKSNTKAADMEKNAAKAGYESMPMLVSASSPHIGDWEGTRSIIKWAWDADEGEVSPVLQDRKQDAYYLVALDARYEDGYRPATDPEVRKAIKAELLNDKKAAKRIDALKGKSSTLEGYAKAMNTGVMQSQSSLTRYGITGLGINENRLQGLIAGAKEGALVGPVQGATHAVVFRVDSRQKQGRPFNMKQDSQTFNQAVPGSIFSNMNIFNVMLGNDKMVNYSLDFEGSAQ